MISLIFLKDCCVLRLSACDWELTSTSSLLSVAPAAGAVQRGKIMMKVTWSKSRLFVFAGHMDPCTKGMGAWLCFCVYHLASFDAIHDTTSFFPTSVFLSTRSSLGQMSLPALPYPFCFFPFLWGGGLHSHPHRCYGSPANIIYFDNWYSLFWGTQWLSG